MVYVSPFQSSSNTPAQPTRVGGGYVSPFGNTQSSTAFDKLNQNLNSQASAPIKIAPNATNIFDTIQQDVNKAITIGRDTVLNFIAPTIKSPIPTQDIVKPQNTTQTLKISPDQKQLNPLQLQQLKETPTSMQPANTSSAQLNTFNPNEMNSTIIKVARALVAGGDAVKQNLVDLAMAFPGNLTPEDKQTPSEKRGLQLMQDLLFGGGAVSSEGIETKAIVNSAVQKLTKNVTETVGNPETYVVASKDLQSLGNSATNELLKSLNLSDSELIAIRKASIGNDSVSITIPPKTILQVADKPWFSKLKTILNQSSTTSTTTLGREAAQPQGITALLKSGENTPSEVINTVIKSGQENTTEGKALIKAAAQAQKQGMNIDIQTQKPPVEQSKSSELIPSASEAKNYTSSKDFADAAYSAKPEHQIGLMDPKEITPRDPVDRNSTQYQALKADIEKNGIQEPIRIDATTQKPITVDGSQRVSVAQDLGIKVPVIVNKGAIPGFRTIEDVYKENQGNTSSKNEASIEVKAEATPKKPVYNSAQSRAIQAQFTESLDTIRQTAHNEQDLIKGINDAVSKAETLSQGDKTVLAGVRTALNKEMYGMVGGTGDYKKDYAILQQLMKEDGIGDVLKTLDEHVQRISENLLKPSPDLIEKRAIEGQPATTVGTGEVKTSKLAERLSKKIKGLKDLPEYKTANVDDQVKMASDLVEKDSTKALQLFLSNNLPSGMLPAYTFEAIRLHAEETGDVAAMTTLGNAVPNLSLQGTAAGQFIQSLSAIDKDSATAKIGEIKKMKDAKVGGSDKVQKVKETLKGDVKKVQLSKEEQSWNNFLDNIKC